jgi:hypothetical protein
MQNLCRYSDGSEVNIDFIKNSFEFGKSEYYLKLLITDTDGGSANVQWRIVPSTNQIPAIKIGGSNASINNWLSYFGSIASNGKINQFIEVRFITTGVSSISRVSYSNTTTLSFGRTNISIGAGVQGARPYTQNITVDTDIPLFTVFDETPTSLGISQCYYVLNGTYDTLLTDYINNVVSGDGTEIDKALNYYNVVNGIPSNKVYSIQNYFKANGTIIETKGYDIKIQPNSKIYFVLNNQIEGDDSPNMLLHITSYPCLVKPYHAPDSAYTESSNVDSSYWWGDWQDSENGITYIGYGSTNIPIFDSEEKGQAYADGDIGEDASINNGSTSIRTSTIGDSLEGTDIPTVNLSTSGVGTYIYALSETQIKNLMSNYLYVTDATLLNNISDGLWLWGNNPIDFFIDCYYIPFDITNFYTTVNADMKFGTYRFESAQGWSTFPVVQETNGQRLVLFNTTFEGIYGDWRDYSQFEYDLFLPFYGFFKLDLYKYLNHTVRCEMMFDVTTHNLRYYLFVDDVITDRIDSSVGINLPLMSSDYVNKAKSDRQARRESDRTAYRAMGAFLTGGLAVAGGIASGNASYAVNGGTSAITSVIDAKYNLDALADKVNENATQSVEGAYSSSMNIYDIRYAYLRITESELIMPDKLNELYGYPSYYMGSASALSGYCEISDIRIKSFTGTVEELNALKGALREGVIL